MSDMINRRDFLKTAAVAGIGVGLAGGIHPSVGLADGLPAPGEPIRVAVLGTNSRGLSHVDCLTKIPGVEIGYICDVDDRAITKGIKAAKRQKTEPRGVKDFRKVLDDKSIDAVTIATPDHWHTPLSILALAAGKHVYVEKPLSQNPHEGELLVQAVEKSGKVLQMGAQRRSFPNLQAGIKAIHDGIIGKTYFGKAWYVNTRASIGVGKPIDVPAWLDYELWQGPAPRQPLMSNLIHYNWHWFWHYGTGEALNNGTHEVDVCRWALGLEFPQRVSSHGGRYQFKDDWQTPDTQVIGWDFAEGKSMTWESRSCNGYLIDGMQRGATVYGTEGSALLDDNNVTIFDRKNKIIKSLKGATVVDPTNTLSSTGGDLDLLHFENFVDAIRGKAKPNLPAIEGHKSVLLLHLGNIAWRTGRMLNCDTTNGHILNDDEAMKLWRRQYEPGWEPKV
jgi:predicted dehydrogenase